MNFDECCGLSLVDVLIFECVKTVVNACGMFSTWWLILFSV